MAYSLPACTCPREPENIETRGCALHDPKSDWNLDPRAFYAEGLPCESCGCATQEPRVWSPESELWIAQDCSCSEPLPIVPACPVLESQIDAAKTVGEVCEAFRQHRKGCRHCSPVEMPAPNTQLWKEAA